MEKLTLFVISLIFIHTVLLRDQYCTVAVSGKQKLSFAVFFNQWVIWMRSSGVEIFIQLTGCSVSIFYQLLRNHELVCCVSISVSLAQYKENRRC